MKQYDLIYNILAQKGIGRVKANKIIQGFEDILKNNEIEENLLLDKLQSFLPLEQVKQILSAKNEFSLKIDTPRPFFINRFQELFPDSLSTLGTNCPPILSCLGNIELLNKRKVGFCGSRKASEKGIEVAQDIAQQVAQKEIVIVSGYASGIDQETHYWALKEGGDTIIVLPEGIENFTIKKHVKNVWDWERVLVISEYMPNAIWSINRAMQRNATIIALSDVMFLIEAKIKGGSIDAGLKTLKMNKPLYAPVYEGMPEEASGNQFLLNKGAFPLKKKRETNRANLDGVIEMLIKLRNNKNTLF